MLEVVERGEMTRVEVLLVLMLEDIFVLEVAMRQLAWNCKESHPITQCGEQKFRELLTPWPSSTQAAAPDVILGRDVVVEEEEDNMADRCWVSSLPRGAAASR